MFSNLQYNTFMKNVTLFKLYNFLEKIVILVQKVSNLQKKTLGFLQNLRFYVKN